MTIGATTGRSSKSVDLSWGREKFVPREDTVLILDRALSKLMLDYDPGEGYEVHLPARSSK